MFVNNDVVHLLMHLYHNIKREENGTAEPANTCEKNVFKASLDKYLPTFGIFECLRLCQERSIC